MKKMKTRFVFKPFALYLAFAFFLIAGIPRNAWAYLVNSQGVSFSRGADIHKIQRALESKVVSQRLAELGLSRDEINSKLQQLNDADVHQFASQLDSLMPGGDIAITIMTVLVVTILVLIIVKLIGYKVIVK